MKTSVLFDVEITHKKYVKLPAPCTYCGKQNIEADIKYFKDKQFYNIMHWGRGEKFGHMFLFNTENKLGHKQKGQVIVSAPYCDLHIKEYGGFIKITIYSLAFMLVSAIIFLLFQGKNLDLWGIAGVLLLFGSFGLILGFVINKLNQYIKPELRDDPYPSRGHWGLQISEVRQDPGEHGIGPVRYFLRLGFHNPESAQRFLVAYPDAKVIKGEKLIQ